VPKKLSKKRVIGAVSVPGAASERRGIVNDPWPVPGTLASFLLYSTHPLK